MNSLFDNTKVAFSLKSNFQLARAYYLFKLMGYAPLVKIGTFLTNLSLRLHLPVKWLIKKTVFNQFCGGVSEKDCHQVINQMYQKGVSSVLDYSVEGKQEEAVFDATFEKILQIIEFAKENPAIPFAVFKPTGFGKFSIYQKLTEGDTLNEQEEQAWERIVNRYDTVCKKAYDLDLPILIDAEESWMQKSADKLALKMMQKYNQKKAIVYNTLQMYRHDRMDYLKKIHNLAEQEDFFIGMKVVRGAYMEKENERAEKMGYATPICESKQATDNNYNACIEYMITHYNRLYLFAGTHNEKSSMRVLELMHEYKIATDDKRVWLGQLYGMSDHISFNLGAEGYNTAKYLPFGPVKEVMPYLIRRAEENTSVQGQMGRELQLLHREQKRRKNLN